MYREEWRAFDAGHWSGAWWMALRSEGRTGRIYVEKHGWNYGANLGFDRDEFHVGGEVRLPILTRVRGHIRLNKIGQRRTHHMADLVFALRHCEKQFRNWALSEGAGGNGLDFRSAARSGERASLNAHFLKTKMPIYSHLNNKMSSNFSDASYIFKGVVHSWEEVVQMHLIFLEKQDMDNIDYSLHRYIETRPELVSIL